MKRITYITVLLACGLLAASTPAFAQADAASSNWFSGKATLLLLGRDDVSSSKFDEYREVAKGVSMPVFSLQGSHNGNDYAVFGQNIARSDQRYFGWANLSWIGISYDYNQIPHNMGYNGRTLYTETAPGVWSMNATLRQALGAAVDATLPTTARTYPFYSALLAPTIAAANNVDISALRQRGDVTFDLGAKLPFDLSLTYLREVKSGARGASGGDILSVVTTAIDVPETLNEVTQDIGIRFAYPFKAGDVHASFNRNIYDNQQDGLIVDNPFRATDLAYVSTSVPGGPASVRFGSAPDNEATRGAFGFLLKFGRQTRITGDMAFGSWTQNAQFLPYTINSVILTPAGAPANSLTSLQASSLNGKIDTTNVNFGFVSRPVAGLGIRLRYRNYDLTNKTTPIVWTGSTSGSPDRSWGSSSINEDQPNGYVTANLYDTKTSRFDAQVSYDIKDLTLEGGFRAASIDRTYREATSGDDNSYLFAALYRASDWLNLRASYEDAHRTADGHTVYGFQADEAERDTTRTGFELIINPVSSLGLTFAYQRRDVDFPNRPDRVQVSGGVPVAGAQPIPGTPSGLLEASYDSYTVEADYAPSERAQFGAYYTYEKDASTTQWSSTTGANLNNLLNFAGSNEGNTFGVNATFQIVPEKWTFSFLANHQKIDGLMDITAREAGSFYTPGRTTLIPAGQGGAADITDWDDTQLTTITAQIDYHLAAAWTFSGGYWYEKYTYADAFSSGDTIFPQSVLFFMKADDGDYKVNVLYTKLTYRF